MHTVLVSESNVVSAARHYMFNTVIKGFMLVVLLTTDGTAPPNSRRRRCTASGV